jgi:hypothetical protein
MIMLSQTWLLPQYKFEKRSKKMVYKKFMYLFLTLLMIFSASLAIAAGGKVMSATGAAPDRYVYYPGTEPLAKDEIRLIACGTGLPADRVQGSRMR